MNLRSPARSVLFICLFAGTIVPSVAMAAPPASEPQEAATPENLQYRKAFAAIEKEDWAEAERLLLPLWERSRTWDIASSLGQAEFMLNKHALGAQHLEFAIDNLPPKENIKVLKRLQKALADMKVEVGTAHIAVQPGAEVLVDGLSRGIAPLPNEVYLEPGTRLLEARMANKGRATKTIEIEAGKTYDVALVLEKSNVEPPPAVVAPVKTEPQPNAPPTSQPESPPDSSPSRTPNWTPVLITGGLAVVAAAIGTGFAIDANAAKSNAADALNNAHSTFGNNPCHPDNGGASAVCQQVQSEQDRRDHSATAATISFISSGVLAAVAVGSYFFWPSPQPKQARVDGWVGRDSAGLSLQGSF